MEDEKIFKADGVLTTKVNFICLDKRTSRDGVLKLEMGLGTSDQGSNTEERTFE